MPNASFLYPLKTSENHEVFWCFQRVEKGALETNGKKRWFAVTTVSFGFLYVNVNELLFSTNSVPDNIVCNCSYVTVFLANNFFEQRVTHLIILSYTPPQQDMTRRIKSHLTSLEWISFYVWSDTKLLPLSLNIDDSVSFLLNNLDKPLMQVVKL